MTTRANMNGEHTSHQPPSHSHSHNQNQNQNQSQNHHQPHNHPHYPHNHPHHHNHNRNGYYHNSSAASFKGCCCCLFLLLTFLGLLVLAIILIIVLAVKPKKPQFELQQVGVQYVGISATPSALVGATTTTTTTTPIIAPKASLSLTIRMVFIAVNPNKVGIKYSGSEFYVMYRGVPLGVASVPGFYQPAHSVRQVETTVGVDRVNLLQADATDLVKDASLNDRVELRVTGDVGAKIRILDFTSPRVKVSVDCAIVISPRKQLLTYKQCGVDGLNV